MFDVGCWVLVFGTGRARRAESVVSDPAPCLYLTSNIRHLFLLTSDL